MRGRILHIGIASILFVLVVLACGAKAGEAVARITPDELKAQLGTVRVLDARSEGDWSTSEVKIETAERITTGSVEEWAADVDKGTSLVIYCS